MSQANSAGFHSPSRPVAYLVVREGDQWGDVFRLTPGQVTTIGRAPTNRIVIRDEICSRKHCELFCSGSTWTLRDLGSRNGTRVDGERSEGDRPLQDGEVVQIGGCELGFTFDPSSFSQPADPSKRKQGDSETAVDVVVEDSGEDSGPCIIHRTRRSRYRSSESPATLGRDRTSRELARLYRLALEMGAARDSRELSQVVLAGVFSGTRADIGAILLLPEGRTDGKPPPSDLSLIAYQTGGDAAYQRVSDYLSRVVLADREAVLARDIADDNQLATRDSLNEISAKSVICTPVRAGQTLFGLIHLYTTDSNQLDPDDLEFTLAVADQFAVALDNLQEKESLAAGLARARDENQTLRRQLELETQLVGQSSTMQRLRQNIGRIAPTDATALIRGESGVGKELVARAIHFNSHRRDGPFVCMNCAALSESLLESELFGHEKGAFTGATGRKTGKFEQADRGTLFLDEVGELGPSVQAKFLRVLEGHPFERVGGGEPIHVDVRVVAATNRNLEEAVKESRFRKDLYFRLHVVELAVKPLREHRSDIPGLAEHFLKKLAAKSGRPVRSFHPKALEALMDYDWPGNVRELQNAIERAVILCPGEEITEADIQLSALGDSPVDDPGGEPIQIGYREVSLDVLEQEHILATLEWTGWNKSRAAQILGIERSTLDRKLKRYQVKRPTG